MQTTGLKGAYLSRQQARLWSWQRESARYQAQCSILINGELDSAALLRALQYVGDQHEILRTTFDALPGMSIPVQVIHDHNRFTYATLSLEGMSESEQAEQLDLYRQKLQNDAFDYVHGPLMRVHLFHFSAHKHILLLNLPALCADTTSLRLLASEILQCYGSYMRGEDVQNDEPLQYIDVTTWLDTQLMAEDNQVQRRYWRKFDLAQISQLPAFLQNQHRRAQALTDLHPQSMQMLVGPEIVNKLQQLAQQTGASLPALLLTTWQVLLWRLTDGAVTHIGVRGDGRYNEDLSNVLGLYSRILPFQTPLAGHLSFEHTLKLVESNLAETLELQEYFTWDQEHQSTSAEASFIPLGFEYEIGFEHVETTGTTFSLLQQSCCTEPFALKLSVLQRSAELVLELHYDAQCLVVDQIRQIGKALLHLLEQVDSLSQTALSQINLLSPLHQQHLVEALSGPARSHPFSTLPQLFAEQAHLHAQDLALVCGQEQLSYKQLNAQANQLAHALRRMGIGANVPVAICMPRSASLLVSLLGILKAGGTYVPLDTEQPTTRLVNILQDVQAALLLTHSTLRERFSNWSGPLLCLDQEEDWRIGALEEDPHVTIEPDDLAYVIYTSGSTGQPKGVMIRHQSLSAYVHSILDLLGAEAGWHWATVSTLAADLGNTAIFGAWASGGCLHVLSYETVTSAQAIALYQQQCKLDVLKIVPSHLSALISGEQGAEVLPRRWLVLGGEALSWGLVERVRELGASCQMVNHYGPTETTVGAIAQVVRERGTESTVPIGRPLGGMQALILDRYGHLMPMGMTGELYLAGAGLAQGYVGRAEQTAERFVPYPFVGTGFTPVRAGSRMYRTGDLVRVKEQGQIEFVGRADAQVKVRGYRVELGEIEAALRAHEQVQACVVVNHEELPGTVRLVAYIVAKHLPGPTGQELRHFLEERLPAYMLPAAFALLRTLPLTSNGKVDRQQLMNTQLEERHTQAEHEPHSRANLFVQPRDDIEQKLLYIWEDILQHPSISVLDNFFDLGGHSILAVQLAARIHKEFRYDLPLAILFQHPTIAELSMLLRQQADSFHRVLVKLPSQGTAVPFFWVHPSGSHVFGYMNLARHLVEDHQFYALQPPYLFNPEDRYNTLQDLAARYIAEIQTIQPQGPYQLGGWSSGGVVAFEMACQLQAQGQEISLLAILDSDTPSPASSSSSTTEAELDISDATLAKELLSILEQQVPGTDLEHLQPPEQLAYALAEGKQSNKIPTDTGMDQIRQYLIAYQINIHLTRTYKAQVYPGKITLFRASASVRNMTELDLANENLAQPTITRGWENLTAQGIEVHLIPGKHSKMLEDPNVQKLAESLGPCMHKSSGYHQE